MSGIIKFGDQPDFRQSLIPYLTGSLLTSLLTIKYTLLTELTSQKHECKVPR